MDTSARAAAASFVRRSVGEQNSRVIATISTGGDVDRLVGDCPTAAFSGCGLCRLLVPGSSLSRMSEEPLPSERADQPTPRSTAAGWLHFGGARESWRGRGLRPPAGDCPVSPAILRRCVRSGFPDLSFRASPIAHSSSQPIEHSAMAVDVGSMSRCHTASSGARVLVVDDDPNVLTLLLRWLRHWQLEATVAQDGVEAMRLIEGGETYDVMLIDRQMPRLDGIELLRRLRCRSEVAPTKAVLMTGSAFERVAALRAGADEYLPKPFGMAELLGVFAALGVAVGVRQ